MITSKRVLVVCLLQQLNAVAYRSFSTFRYSSLRGPIQQVGPNAGQPPEFFHDPDVLKREIIFYLSERENESARRTREKKNQLLEFFSIEPAKFVSAAVDADAGMKKSDPDVLESSELSAYGYEYLIEPIMRAGGYVEVSKMMDIPLSSYAIEAETLSSENFNRSKSKEGFLTLGNALTERLNGAESVISKSAASVFDRQDGMVSKRTKTIGDQLPSYLPIRTGAKNASAVGPEKSNQNPTERFLLTNSQKFFSALVTASVSIGYGVSTPDAVGKGLPVDAVEFFQTFSCVLLIVYFGTALYSVQLAAQKKRSPMIWLAKGIISGPASLNELNNLSDIQ